MVNFYLILRFPYGKNSTFAHEFKVRLIINIKILRL